MALSNAVPQTAVSKTLGYALDYKDLQTAQGNLPVRILVLSDGVLSDDTSRTKKVLSATAEKVKEKLGEGLLGFEVMEILDELKAKQFIDVLAIDRTSETLKKDILDAMGDVWYNLIVNPFATDKNVYKALKEINGSPAEDGGVGRWNALEVKPFVAISGTNESVFVDIDGTVKKILEADDLTNVVGVAPNAFADELAEENIIQEVIDARIAASYAFLAYKQFSTKPYLDISGKVLPYISYPKDLEIGKMSDWQERDAFAKNGICTVTLDAGQGGYVIADFVTGRRMSTQAETAKDWRWVRDLFVDFNVAYKYQILQNKTLMNKVIVSDDEIIQADRKGDSIRLKVWKAAVINFFEQMVKELFITDAKFCVESLLVELSGTNPKRINTQFAYKRTSTVNIASTTAYVGFAFGENA